MSRFAPRPRRSLRALAAFAVAAAASASCTLDLSGLGAGGAGGASTSVSVSSGEGGKAVICTPGDVQACYEGSPASTMNIAPCKAGTQTCNDEGTAFSACAGQTLPTVGDDCTNYLDTDCDGLLACKCDKGLMIDCYEGPSETLNRGICKAGTRTCKADGMSYGTCDNQITPKPEDCSKPEDEDCNGKSDDDAKAGCVCDPTKVAGCMTTYQGKCSGGTQHCLPTGMGYEECTPIVAPEFDDCFSSEDEDCDGTPIACTGSSVSAGSPEMSAGHDGTFSVAVDKANNIFLGGVSNSAGGNSYLLASGTAEVVKINANGTQAWKKTYAATYSVVRGVTTDQSGNVIVIGEYRGTINTNGVSLTSAMDTIDVFVLKLDPSGTPLWSKSFGADGDQFGTSIAADASGDIFVIGYMSGTMPLGSSTLKANGGPDFFLVKLAANGDVKWGKSFGDGGYQIGWHVAAAPDGSVVVTGTSYGDIDLGGGFLGYSGNNKGDIFFAKFDGGGAHKWSKRFGDGEDQAGYGVAVDAKGFIMLSGVVQGATDFGGGPLTASGGKPEDAFVARFDANGAHKWSKIYGDSSPQYAYGLALDPAGNALISGSFAGTLQLGNTMLKGVGQGDVFVAKLKALDGSVGWARSFGDGDDQISWAIAADSLGDAILGGTYKGVIDFGPPAGLSFTSSANYDAFWAKLAP